MKAILCALAFVALAVASGPGHEDIFAGNEFFMPNEDSTAIAVNGDTVTVVSLPSHGKSEHVPNEHQIEHAAEKAEETTHETTHEQPTGHGNGAEKETGKPEEKPEHPHGGPPKSHPAKPIHQKCGHNDKFYDDGNGVQYHFPSGGNVPKLGYTYRPEGNKKASSYSVAFSKLFFKEFTNSTGREKLTTISLNSFKWYWDNCDMMELSEIPGTVYYVLHGINAQRCIQAEFYVSFTVDTNSSTSILKVIATFSNAPECKGRRSFSEMLASYNTVGVQFQYKCNDFGEDKVDPRCQVEEFLEGPNDLSETLTYNSSTLSQTLVAHAACWGERSDEYDATTEPANQTCYPGAGPITRFGFGWPLDEEGGPRNQAQYRMEAGYEPEAVTDNTVISLDPFSFRFEPEAAASPVFPYTPSCLEETAGRDNSVYEVSQFLPDVPALEVPVELEPLAEENSRPVGDDQSKTLHPEIITQEIVYDTTYRDASLVALVAFLVVSLVLTFFLARKSETPSV